MSGANRLTAVLASRRLGPESLELFPTPPPWATRALVSEILRGHLGIDPSVLTALDPACGRGHMAIPLAESFASVVATDVHDWGFGVRRDLDFTFASREDFPPVDWMITNPPFTLAERFLVKALSFVRLGVAMLLRLQFLEGGERYRQIYGPNGRRPILHCPFSERVPMIEDVWDPEASSATAYSWFIWSKVDGPMLMPTLHIPPGMEQRYTRLSDMALATPGEAACRRAAKRAEAP